MTMDAHHPKNAAPHHESAHTTTTTTPRTPIRGRNTQLFELVQKLILPEFCRSSGKFVLNSASNQIPKSYENHHPSNPKHRHPPHLPHGTPNNTTTQPSHDLAAQRQFRGIQRQNSGKSGNLAA